MKRLFLLIISGILLFSISSCEKDKEPLPAPHMIEVGDGAFECRFHLPQSTYNFDWGFFSDKLQLIFYPLGPTLKRVEPFTYNGYLLAHDEHIVTFRHGGSYWGENLPSGRFLMRLVLPDNGKYLVKEFTVAVSAYGLRIITPIESSYNTLDPLYDNDTTAGYPGSEGNPYIIASYDDFRSMCSSLRKDETAGRGLHFLQTANIEVPGTSGALAEDGWFGTDFAGTYSGAEEGITIFGFSFAGSDMGNENKNIGLFRTLKSGATFKKIILYNNGINGVSEKCGILAGSIETDGIVKISDCQFRGTISDSKFHTGGIIGYMSGGSIEILNTDIGAQILQCGEYTGGIIGYVTGSNPQITIDGLTSKLQPIVVKGSSYVGGIFGKISNADLTLKNIKLAHESTQSENEAIVGSGPYVGGIAGELYSSDSNAQISLDNVSLSFPIKGKDNTGGLFGKVNNAGYTLKLTQTRVSSNLIGAYNAGGFIGSTDSESSDGSHPFKMEFNDYVGFGVINSNYTKVSGSKNVGGMMGYASNIEISADNATVKIETSVSGSSDNIGGLIGAFVNCSKTLSLKRFQFASQSEITGKNNVGGVCGYMARASMDGGRYNFSFPENTEIYKIPTQSEFEKEYIGSEYSEHMANVALKVKGETNIGGIAGLAEEKSKITNIYVCAEVSGTQKIGGAVGYFKPGYDNISSVDAYNPDDASVGYHFDTYGSAPYKENYIRGVITGATQKGISADKVLCGGIVGELYGSGVIAHCMNYASISNGNHSKNEGGAIGHGGIAGEIGYNSPGAPLLYYCVNAGEVNGDSVVGGVCGRIVGGSDANNLYLNIQYCANFGKVICNQKKSFPDESGGCGGIFGDCGHPGILVAGCANHGEIKANAYLQGVGGIGGVLGYDPGGAHERHNGVVIGCANTGSLDNQDTRTNMGGIIGWMEEGRDNKGDAAVLGCYNKGRILTMGGNGRAGIVCYVDRYAEIQCCISFTAPDYTNDECNLIWANEKGSYYIKYNYMTGDYDRSYADNINTSNMSDPATFPHLHLNESNSYWKMSNGDPHPQIRYCPFQNATYNK